MPAGIYVGRAGLEPATLGLKVTATAGNVRVHVVPELGDIRLQALTALDLDRLYGRLLACGRRGGRGLSPRSVRYVHTILHGALDYAGRKNLVPRNVAKLADPPEGSIRSDSLVWSPDELQRFLEHIASDRLAALWLTLATTECDAARCWVCPGLTLTASCAV